MEDITDVDYRHAKRVFKNFNKNFRNKCIGIYEFDPGYVLSAPALAWQAYLKKAGVKLELLRDINMLLIIEKGIRGGMCLVSCNAQICRSK